MSRRCSATFNGRCSALALDSAVEYLRRHCLTVRGDEPLPQLCAEFFKMYQWAAKPGLTEVESLQLAKAAGEAAAQYVAQPKGRA